MGVFASHCLIDSSLSFLFSSLLYFNDIHNDFLQGMCSWRSLLQQIFLSSRNSHLSCGERGAEHCHESTNKISPEVRRDPSRTLPQTFPATQDIKVSEREQAVGTGSSRRIFVRRCSSQWLVFQVKNKTGKISQVVNNKL